ncbi:hypothetical protein EON64_09430 [archaeon]|nr:MAG: hypothetical protein EON64_09430 [archaeon]
MRRAAVSCFQKIIAMSVISEERSVGLKNLLVPLSQNVKLGIIGGSNIGKSALFNCIAKSLECQSIVENALFTTVDPYCASFEPYDERVEFIRSVYPDATDVVKTCMTVVDIPAIVPGAFREVILDTIA